MTDKLTQAAVGLITLTALVGAIVLTALGFQVPDLLPYVVTTGIGVLGGSALPRAVRGSVDDPGSGGPASGSVPRPPTDAELEANPRSRQYKPSALTRTDTGKPLHPRARKAA